MNANLLRKTLSTWLKTQPKSQGIAVLGSGRCGTSMVTRSLSFLGVDIGNEFIKTNEKNPKGFWENKKVVDIQKEINKVMRWKRPYESGWQENPKIRPYKEQLKRMTKNEFANKQYWAWKDPRNCECLDLWKEILDELSMAMSAVIMIRNPIDVADSFKEAYNDKTQKSLRLWYVRTLTVLAGTENMPRVMIDYNDFLDDSFGSMRMIADSLNLPWPDDDAELKRKLDDFVDPGLRHRATDLDELRNSPDIDADFKTLYELCLKASRDREFFESRSFRNEVDELHKALMESGMKV
ncbi:MAG TPA: sulfotransferase [Bacillales bacterium]|nr:sulfotransferase [Bacillales bacterium]